MSVQAVSVLLRDLGILLCSGDEFNATSALQELRELTMQTLSPAEQDVCIPTVLDGLLLLTRPAALDSGVPGKLGSFVIRLLEDYLVHIGSKGHHFYSKIFNQCYRLIRAPLSAYIRTSAFGPFILILDSRVLSVGDFSTDPAKMIAGFMFDISQGAAKTPLSVKGALLKALGILADLFPAEMADSATKLLKQYLSLLSNQKKLLEVKIVGGVFSGLDRFLNNFSELLSTEMDEQDPKSVVSLYKLVFTGISVEMERSVSLTKSSLSFLTSHAPLFRQFLLRDTDRIAGKLMGFCSSHNKGLRDLAFEALERCVSEICIAMVSLDDPSLHSTSKIMLTHLLELFYKALSDMSEVYHVSASIRALGALSPAIKTYFGAKEHLKFITRLISHGDVIYSQSVEDSSFLVHQFPYFALAYARMIHQTDCSDAYVMGLIRHIPGKLFRVYPTLIQKYREVALMALIKLFVVLKVKSTLFPKLLSDCVYQGLVLTISELPESPQSFRFGNARISSHQEYHPLWVGLLTTPETSEWNDGIDLDVNVLDDMQTELHSQIVKSSIIILETLDLSLISSNEELTVSSLDTALLKPKVSKDFQLFHNLVNFCESFLPSTTPYRFIKWALPFTQAIVSKSQISPLVSGLYKFVGIVVDIIHEQRILYHVKYSKDSDFYAGLGMPRQSAVILTDILTEFYTNVVARVPQYENELLHTCLEFVLKSPPAFFPLKVLSPVYKRTLRIGLSHIESAQVAVASLQKFISHHSNAGSLSLELDEIKKLVPSMLEFLGHESSNSEEEVIEKVSPKTTLVFDILKLLGSLGIEFTPNMLVTEPDWLMSWDDRARVLFKLPYLDRNLPVYLDTLLPRVVYLALRSPERKLKISACEFLHAVIVLIVGANATNPVLGGADPPPTPFEAIYKRIFPCILQLATDADSVSKQIFRNLMFQLIHWFSQSVQREANETSALLESITHALGHPSDASLRTFAAECIAEFFSWAAKHSSNSESIVNADSLLRRVYALFIHPNPFNRLGACLALNSIYRTFREHDCLISQHILLVLKNSLLCISHSSVDQMLLQKATSSEAKAVAMNYLRILTSSKLAKHSIVMKDDWNRRGGSEASNLKAFCNYLLLQVTKKEFHLRRLSMSLLEEISPLLGSTVHEFIAHSYPTSTIVAWMETSLPGIHGTSHTIMKDLVSVLDLHIWVASKTDFMFRGDPGSALDTVLENSLHTCLTDGSKIDRESSFSEYNVTKQRFAKGAARYICILFRQRSERLSCYSISRLVNLFIRMLLDPRLAGFSVSIPTETISFQQEISKLIALLGNTFQNLILSEFKHILASNEETNLWEANLDTLILDGTLTPVLLNGYCELWKTKTVQHCEANVLAEYIQCSGAKILTPIGERNLRYLFQLTLIIGVSKETLLSLFGDSDLMRLFGKALSRYVFNSISVFSREVIDLFFTSSDSALVLRACFIDSLKSHAPAYQPLLDELATRQLHLSSDLALLDSQLDLLLVLSRLNVSGISRSLSLTEFLCSCVACPDVEYLPAKVKSIQIASVVLKSSHADFASSFLRAVSAMIARAPFPPRSTDITKGTMEFENYLKAIDSLLEGVATSLDMGFLSCCLPVFAEPKHALSARIRRFFDEFVKTLILSGSPGQEYIETCIIYSLGDNQANFSAFVLSRISIPFLKLTGFACVDKLFERFRSPIWSTLCLNGKPVVPDYNDSITYERISNSYTLLQAFISRLPKTTFEKMAPKMEIAKTANYHLKNVSPLSDLLKADVNSLFFSSTFGFLVDFIVRTQKKESIFRAPFDKLNFSRIVDTNNDFQMSIDTDFAKVSVTVDKPISTTRPRYLSTQYLADSSLSQDVPYLEAFLGINSSSNHGNSSSYNSLGSDNLNEVHQDDHASTTERELALESEMDFLNSNPSMIFVLRIVDKSLVLFKEDYDSNEMPKVLRILFHVFSDESQALNVRLFIARVVVNRQSSFKPYASVWFRPLVELMLMNPPTSRKGLPRWAGFHYFLRDLVSMLLLWEYIPSDPMLKLLASELVEHLISVSHDYGHLALQPEVRATRTQYHGKVLKLTHNIKLVQDVVKLWHSFLAVKKDAILSHLVASNEDPREVKIRRTTGLQILASLLANGIPEYSLKMDGHIDNYKYFEVIFSCMKSTTREIYEASAEVYGMMVALYQTHPTQTSFARDEFKAQVLKYLTSIYSSVKAPSFVSRSILNKILPLLPSVTGEVQCWSLETLLWCSSSVDDILSHLRPLLISLFTLRNLEAHRLVLLILLSIVSSLSTSEIDEIMHNLYQVYRSHSDETCRVSMYKLLGFVIKTHQMLDLQQYLLSGLKDESPLVRKLVYSHCESILSTSLHERLSQCISWIYTPEIESIWLGVASYLLLEPCSLAPDFSEPLVHHSLGECKFSNMVVDPTYHSFISSATVPLFSETSHGSHEHTRDLKGLVLATQAPQFALTQSIAEMDMSQPMSFVALPASMKRSTAIKEDPDDVVLGSIASFAVHKKPVPVTRFGSGISQGAKSVSISRMDTMRRHEKEWGARLAAERRNTVSIYRQYRVGELPDIQIPAKDLILSLQGLHSDSVIGKILFGLIFDSLVETIDDSRARDQIATDIFAVIEKTSCVPAFVSTMMLACTCFESTALDPGIISGVAIRAHSYHSGILLLEHHMVQLQAPSQKGKKRRVNIGDDTSEIIRRIGGELARLYRSIGERDIVLGLYDRYSCESETKLAIAATLDGEFDVAVKHYDSLLSLLDSGNQNQFSLFEVDLWEDERLVCLEKLGKFDAVVENALAVVDSKSVNLWNPSYFNTLELQKHLLQTYSRNAIQSRRQLSMYSEFVSNALEQEAKREMLERYCCSELVQLFALQGERAQAALYIERGYSEILREWSQTPSLALLNRSSILQSLQPLTEVSEYFEVWDENEITHDTLRCVLRTWKARLPTSPDAAHDSIFPLLSTRVRLLPTFLKDLSPSDSALYRKLIIPIMMDSLKVSVKVAISHKYGDRALCFLKDARRLLKKASEPDDFELYLFDFQVKLQHGNVDVSQLVSELEEVHSQFTNRSSSSEINYQLTVSKSLPDITQSYRWLDRAVRVGRADSHIESSVMAEALLSLGLLCCKLLEESINLSGNLCDQAVGCILEAVGMGSSTAISYIPKALQNATENSWSRAGLLPIWVFIRWIPQLLGGLGGTQCELVLPILVKLATIYPQALYYPFTLTSEDLHGNTSCKQALDTLQSHLKNSRLEALCNAFGALDFPQQIFGDWQKSILSACSAGELRKASVDYKRMYMNCFHRTEKAFRKFKKSQADFDTNFGANGELLSSIQQLVSDRNIDGLTSVFKKIRLSDSSPPSGKIRLDSMSAFLASFHAINSDIDIEIPGQYDGYSLPYPETHIRLLGVGPEIVVMKSLRRPKLLKLIGSDEREHRWLLKSGEDLRLDQRIQQVFTAMNETYASDTACSEREIRVRTYTVVPLNSRVGLIEWVGDTSALKSLIHSQLSLSNSENLIMKLVNEQYSWFQNKVPMSNSVTDIYAHMFRKVSRAEIVDMFYRLQDRIPSNILSRSISAFCASNEAFLLIRARFTRSYAVFCMSSYILGIGDRHLDNFLVDKTTGDVIGIDYGMAFGQGISLAVPELMPFRLTRVFTSFLHPIDFTSLLRFTMRHTLSALQNNKSTILHLLEVFVQEPHLDWQSHIQTDAAESKDPDTDECRKRINFASHKLNGHSCTSIMLEELASSPHAKKKYYKSLCDIVKGTGDNIRSELSNKGLSITEQIDGLIDHATDPNILGRSYYGWAAFV